MRGNVPDSTGRRSSGRIGKLLFLQNLMNKWIQTGIISASKVTSKKKVLFPKGSRHITGKIVSEKQIKSACASRLNCSFQ